MAQEKRDYLVVDNGGRVVLSRIDMANDFTVANASNGLGWSGGDAPFKVYAAIAGADPGGYGLIGEVPAGEVRAFTDTGIAPDLEIQP